MPGDLRHLANHGAQGHRGHQRSRRGEQDKDGDQYAKARPYPQRYAQETAIAAAGQLAPQPGKRHFVGAPSHAPTLLASSIICP
jgi:hypothetical protein